MPGGVTTDGRPNGWAWATVGDLLAEPTCNGISVKGSDAPPGVPALRLSAMTAAGFNYDERRYIPITDDTAEELSIRVGDLYVSRGNGSLHLLGRATLAQEPPERIVFPDTMIRLRFISDAIAGRFVNLLWQSREVRKQIEGRARTTAGIYKISQRDVEAFSLPLPPLAEQRRIVAKVEELFSDLDAGVAALERVRANLKRYRAAVLKAAVEGRITADWRAAHPDAEPASELLARVLADRRAKWEADQLAKFAAADKSPPKDWQAKYAEPTAPDTANLLALPKGWYWADLEQLVGAHRPICYGILMPKDHIEGGVLYVKVRDMKGDRIDVAKLNRTTPEIAQEYARATLRAGDLLLAIRGTYGRVAEIPPELDGGNITQDSARLAILPDVNTTFVAWCLRSVFCQNYFKRVARGVAVKGVNIADVRLCPIPLPPLAEQEQIVAEVEERLSVASVAERQVEADLARAARLRQAILKRAFAGKLVPQDPADEPAEMLLERIRAGSNTPTPARTPARRGRGAKDSEAKW